MHFTAVKIIWIWLIISSMPQMTVLDGRNYDG